MGRRVIGLVIVLALAWGGLGALTVAGITPRLGLDLQGGTSVVLTAPPDTDEEVLEVAVEVMRNRIEDIGGVQEPEIAISGSNTVVVQLPGVEDERRALDAIGQTGQLSFRPVLGETPGGVGPLAGDDAPAGIDPVTGLSIDDDLTTESYLVYERASFLTGETVSAVLHLGPAQLLGGDVASAVPGFNTANGQWSVSLGLTGEGGEIFAELTGEAARYGLGDPRRQIAIVLDGEVLAAPEVNIDVSPGTGITGGQASITLGATPDAEQEAQDLGVVLRYGSLPVSFERSSVSKVSASLGTDSLLVGLYAGAAGLALVAILLLVFYRALGLVALVGLTVFGSLLIGIFSALGALESFGLTLTLAGVTGIIVAVGITADSYIVYFERVKDEVRAGADMETAVTDGFKDAYRTILTADTVSLLGAVLLYLLAVGAVRGFALALGIATVLDLFVARVYTRRAVWLLGRSRLGDGGAFSIAGAAGAKEATS
ncbi:MAG: protein translocase subunit SecD [Acidimicrobiia bacterium]